MTILFTKNPKLKIYKFSVKLKDCQYNHNFLWWIFIQVICNFVLNYGQSAALLFYLFEPILGETIYGR